MDFVADFGARLRAAIIAHEAETGVEPVGINCPRMTFMGLPLHFYDGDKIFTYSEGRVVHHIFKDHSVDLKKP